MPEPLRSTARGLPKRTGATRYLMMRISDKRASWVLALPCPWDKGWREYILLGWCYLGELRQHEAAKKCNARSPQVANVGGQLVVVFMTNHDATNPPAWPDGASIKIIKASSVSEQGIAWSKVTLVNSASSYWPSLLARDARTALVGYDGVLKAIALADIGRG